MRSIVEHKLMKPILSAAGVALLAVLPLLGLHDYWIRQVVLVAILALVVSGLNLSFGYAGE